MFLRFLTKYSVRACLLSSGLALLSAGITPSSFADDAGKKLGLLPTYSLCLEQANGDDDAMADCDVAEHRYQEWRLNTTYQALMKILPPPEQKKLRQKERVWLKNRDTICQRLDSKEHIKYPTCIVSKTATQAGNLEDLLKENGK